MTTGRFITLVVGAFAFFLVTMSAVVALTWAGKPVSTVVYLMTGFAAQIFVALIGLLKIQNLAHDVRNGVGDGIAQKVVDKLPEPSDAVPGGLRASDPPATMVSPTPPEQDGAA